MYLSLFCMAFIINLLIIFLFYQLLLQRLPSFWNIFLWINFNTRLIILKIGSLMDCLPYTSSSLLHYFIIHLRKEIIVKFDSLSYKQYYINESIDFFLTLERKQVRVDLPCLNQSLLVVSQNLQIQVVHFVLLG